MNLLAQAESDNSFILEDTENGFGRSASFQDPDTEVQPVVVGVQYIRIGFKIDPSTGLPVAGDTASVTARISSLVDAVDHLPIIPTDGWTVTVDDSTGTSNVYKIEKGKTMWDRTAGRVTFHDLKRVG